MTDHPVAPDIRLFHKANTSSADRCWTSLLGLEACHTAQDVIKSWPGYQPTPLISLPGLADAVGVGSIHYKDEGGRFGLGSFKALGGAYGVWCGLRNRNPSEITVATATDGNHGRSVAWAARMFGCKAVIFLHAHVSEGRQKAIEAYGAKIVTVTGNYDESVRECAENAAANDWLVISDTSYPGYRDVPRQVMQGYTLMAEEIMQQKPAGHRYSHVLIQGGCGGLAGAVADYMAATLPAYERPRFSIIEPDAAACLFESARTGSNAIIAGEMNTIMAGLACGEISLIAWDIISKLARDFITISDPQAKDCMRLLADPPYGDPPIVAGESAVAGLVPVIAAKNDLALRDALYLDHRANILVFGTEGATDPELYEDIVRRPAENLRRTK